MIRTRPIGVFTGNSPATATTALVAGLTVNSLGRYSWLRIDALLQGGTGGTLDIYLQRLWRPYVGGNPGTSVWLDWVHFPQLSAAASHKYTLFASVDQVSTAITEVGQLSDDLGTGSLVLPANTFTGGMPGDEIRAVAVAGASTTAGAAQTLYVFGGELYT